MDDDVNAMLCRQSAVVRGVHGSVVGGARARQPFHVADVALHLPRVPRVLLYARRVPRQDQRRHRHTVTIQPRL